MSNRIKSLSQRLFRTGFYHIFGSGIINKVLSFVSSFALVRIIPKEAYGVYGNADNILSIFCIFEGLGFVTSFLQFGTTSKGEDKKNIWSYSFYFSTMFQMLLCVVILFTGLFIPMKMEGTNTLLVAMAFIPLPRLIRDLMQTYLRTELNNKLYAKSNTFSTVVTVVLSISLSVFLKEYGLIIANYISAVAAIIYILCKKAVRLPGRKNTLERPFKKKIIKFSLIATLNNSTSSIMYLLDTFVLGIVVASSVVTASYKVATKIPTALTLITTCVITYIYPYFAKNKNDKKWCWSHYKKVVLALGLFNFALVGLLVAFAPLIIKIFFGAQYLDAVVPFRLLCANYFVHSTFGTVPGHLLVSQEKLGINTFSGFFGSALNTVLNLLLIPLMASAGAALATLIVSTVIASIKTTGFIICLKKPPKKRVEDEKAEH